MKTKRFCNFVLIAIVLLSGGTCVNLPHQKKSIHKGKSPTTSFGQKYDIVYGGGGREPNAFYEPYGQQPNSIKKHFSIPEGTVIKLTPEITIPCRQTSLGSFDFESKFQAGFPISMTFKKKKGDRRNGHFHRQNVWKHKLPSVEMQHLQQPVNYSVNAIPDNHLYHHHKRQIRSLELSNCSVKSLTDRMAIIDKVELTGLRMFGFTTNINPKECLLRAICELHEGPVIHRELGLLGELVTVIFTFTEITKHCSKEELSFTRFLRPYIEAELAGKSKACKSFREKCSKSIFSYA